MSKKAVVTEQQYQAILKPVITEKSTAGSEHNKVVFKVRMDADKKLIKEAVEAIFGVKVVKVNTLVSKGKTKIFRGREGLRSDTKKAIVTLKEGETLNIAGGA